MNYVADIAVPGTAAWNITAAPNPPAVAGAVIQNPAVSAGQYFYFGMDAFASVDLGGQYLGLFTTSLCGCIAGFLVRTNGGVIRRIAGYHMTSMGTVPQGAILLFNAAGANGPQPGDVNYLIRPDKAGMVMGLPDDIDALIGNLIPRGNAHTYRREEGNNVSWIISLNGDMGEMTDQFALSRSDEQQKGFGVQAAIALPPPPAGKTCCIPCVIM
jgi:hypothetical protein